MGGILQFSGRKHHVGDTRSAAGFPEPFRVKYWAWETSLGCGGDFTPEEYAVEFRRFTSWLPTYGDELKLVASGPNTDEWNWTREFLKEVLRKGRAVAPHLRNGACTITRGT